MNVPILQRHVEAAQLPLERLASSTHLTEAEKMAEVSRQFEAILLRQVLSEAQKPVFQSAFSSSSIAGDIYRDLITHELAERISRSGSFGLATALETQLQRQSKPMAPPAHSAEPPLSAAGKKAGAPQL